MVEKEKKVEDKKGVIAGIEVRDPEILKPEELPLVIPTPEGGWANEAQATYARYLNGYAYKNPAKWEKKKADRTVTDSQGRQSVIKGLVTRLAELAVEPGMLSVYNGDVEGVQGRLEYKNKRVSS